MAQARFQSPKGTRDLYPEDMLRRRYITQAWRDTSIRHGFEEVDGPTFESSELYAVKSGDGILGELFQAFSGKDPKDLEFIKEHDRAQLALRPEFTPTLARLYAARAAQLPKPTKWFSIGPFFRAERPQRGRLREFLQWNADSIGNVDDLDEFWSADTEMVLCCGDGLAALGVNRFAGAHISHRKAIEEVLQHCGLSPDSIEHGIRLVDALDKMSHEDFIARSAELGMDGARTLHLLQQLDEHAEHSQRQEPDTIQGMYDSGDAAWLSQDIMEYCERLQMQYRSKIYAVSDIGRARGLAYYTGTVFEVIADGERAVAGGGRYDNLIELLGGPPTPAVGFAMGDVVLSLLLEDKNLMPEGPDLLEACSKPGASLRPEAFVVTADESLDPAVRRLVADLRRGRETEDFDGKPWARERYAEGVRPLHARRSYKSTRKIQKLAGDANAQHARTLVIVESESHATVQDLDRKDKLENVALDAVPAEIARITA